MMMSPTHEEDPFLQVQQEVLTALQAARPLFSSYLRIRSLSSSSSSTTASPELASARADVESALDSLNEDIADLTEAVRTAAADPAAFGINSTELKRRQRLVKDVGAEVSNMRAELSRLSGGSSGGSESAFSGAALAARAAASSDAPPDSQTFASLAPKSSQYPPASPTPSTQLDPGRTSDSYTEFEAQQQVQMMRDQDEQLDGVFVTVGNLRRQANDMGRELEEQHEMLEHVDALADRVGGSLATGVAKMAVIVRQNEDRWSGCCIYVLITILIVLLVLLLIL